MNKNCLINTKYFLPALFIVLVSCSTISRFDQYAYSQETSIKVDALNVMNFANEQYAAHEAEVNRVRTSIDKMYEYEKNRPKNLVSEKMWLVLKDTSGHLFGGFIRRWQKEGTLHTVFIKEAQSLVSDSFDQLSQLESGKIKPAQIAN